MRGAAVGEQHALVLIHVHETYACPATASSDRERDLRIARRRPLTALYPAEVPPYPRSPDPMTILDRLRETALADAVRGWHVFPLRPGGKLPAFPDHSAGPGCDGRDRRCRAAARHVTWEERATTDPDRITRAWSAGRPYNVGIACGPSGLVVVDLDEAKPGADVPEAWQGTGVETGMQVLQILADRAGEPMPTGTYTVRTASGGLHLYFRHPPGVAPLRNTAGARGGGLGWLIDTRAHGGLAVAAGSRIGPDAYEVVRDAEVAPLPGWLAERLAPRPMPPQRPVAVPVRQGRAGAYLAKAVQASLDLIADAADGTLNTTLYNTAISMGQFVAGGALDATAAEDMLTAAAVRKDHPEGAARRTVRSGFRAGAQRPRVLPAD
ncbi:bifunctional DNA primase/polymerase [Catenuloplanes japonicus]|uniref:bifunctional DNA primase/polymerase n=1 Tax=Catenuloplanes japonicus TaxID=33876 RepID=UPI000A6D60CB|nr:bifunctional DNA primase/polymerase [Catenuloplanes japonicus]